MMKPAFTSLAKPSSCRPQGLCTCCLGKGEGQEGKGQRVEPRTLRDGRRFEWPSSPWMLQFVFYSNLWTFPGGSDGKESACDVGDLGLILTLEDPLEKRMATHSSSLAWRIPWTKELASDFSEAQCGLRTYVWEHAVFKMGLPKWLSGKESACQFRRCRFNPWVGKIPWRRKWQSTPVFLPGKSHGQRRQSKQATVYGVAKELDMT